MGKQYARELTELQDTLLWSSQTDIASLANVIRSSYHYPMISVGSGGSYSAAELHVSLHQQAFHSVASACTPMELTTALPFDGYASVWFMSASGNNIDIRRGFKHTALSEPRNIISLVGRLDSKLAALASKYQYTDAFEYPLPSGKDGFLATNSLLAFSTLLFRAYQVATGQSDSVPDTIEKLILASMPDSNGIEGLKKLTADLCQLDTFHIIYSTKLKSTAIDIESKFIEAGLSSVHLADLRNFAHGRHHWFDKQPGGGLLCLTLPEDADLGDKTLSLLPSDIVKIHIPFESSGGIELLAGLVFSFYLAHWRGKVKNIDPGRPGVPDYGSKIYRLTAKSGFISSLPREKAAITRKIAHGPTDNPEYKTWQMAYKRFMSQLGKHPIGGIILDYDGTLVDGRRRGYPPEPALCAELIRLLDAGIKVGFATGRGKSIRLELRNEDILPEKYWDQILVGYYNGSDISYLSDESSPNGVDGSRDELESIAKLLTSNLQVDAIKSKITKREKQVTVEPSVATSESFLWQSVRDQLSYCGNNDAKVVRSSHSIDIIARDVSKVAVISEMEKFVPPDTAILAIGDRGRWPGNDTELLGSRFSLSVDEVSSAQDRCWNLCPAGIRGPQGTLNYLNRIHIKNGLAFFK